MFNVFRFSKTAKAVSLLLTSLTLVACGSDNNSSSVVVTPDDDNPAATVLTPIKGHWNKLGYGQFLSIDDQSVDVYEFNQFGCIQTDSLDLAAVEGALVSAVKTEQNELAVMLKGQLAGEYYQSAPNLPESCEAPIVVSETNSPIETFEYFWHSFNDYYAFFAARGVNWQQQYQQYRPLVSEETSDEQLIDIISGMIAPLQDAHVSLSADEFDFSVGKTIPMHKAMIGALVSSFRSGSPVEFEQIESAFESMYYNIQQSYILPETFGQYPQDDQFPTLMWGKTTDNVGVLVINNMIDFADDFITDEGVDFTALIAGVHAKMVPIMLGLADTDGLIIDIRNNQGGTDDVSLAIANYFANQETHVFDKQAITTVGNGYQYSATLVANDLAYTNPVYVLTSQKTTSAAEIFTMAMDALEHVTIVGEPTSGALSDVLDINLPNGWSMSLSNEVYKNSAGDVFEVTGIIPDHHIPAYSLESLATGKFESYDFALEQLGKYQGPQLSRQQFESNLTELMAQGLIPGAAVAVVKGDEIVYQQGFGRADELGTEVNQHTPFFLASVSKTILGTTIAQVEADELVDINEPIQNSLSFSVEYPDDQDFQPSFRHLVTHTSGIIDEVMAFGCSYYVVEDRSSLVNMFDPSRPCEDDMDIDMGNFLNRYLSSDGDLHQSANFTSEYSMPAGEVSFYSNFATALAGLALEEKTGKSLPQLTNQYVTAPLGMNNTSWSIEGTPANTALRYFVNEGVALPLPDYNAITYPDGGAISTAHDLAKYMIAVKNGGLYNNQQVLSPGAVDKMLTNQTDAAVTERGVGYFWRLDGFYFSHNGGDPGVMSQIWADTNKDIAVVLLTNGDSFDDAAMASFDDMLSLLKTFAYSH